MDGIELRPVSRLDCKFLYHLLEERPKEANISHQSMPTWKEHVNFVENHPYIWWKIIFKGGNKLGSFYLTKQNEIGIFVAKDYQRCGIARKVIRGFILDSIPRKIRILANTNPNNEPSIALFERLGFKHIQNTYELTL